MLPLRTFALWLLMAFLGQQVSVSSVAGAAGKLPGRAQRGGNKGAASGKFSTRDKMKCTWGAKDAGDTVKLRVKCEDPEARTKGGYTDLICDYNGKPQRCPGYLSDPKGFWKQVARAFKRLHGKVCRDDGALVKAGMCKRAPRDAHFKLDISTSVESAQSGELGSPPPPPPRPRPTVTGPTACTKRANHWGTAEEYCSSSWASVCSFSCP